MPKTALIYCCIVLNALRPNDARPDEGISGGSSKAVLLCSTHQVDRTALEDRDEYECNCISHIQADSTERHLSKASGLEDPKISADNSDLDGWERREVKQFVDVVHLHDCQISVLLVAED